MSTDSTAFVSPGFASEHYSVQRHLASLFPDTEIRRRYEEGAFTERPYVLVSMVNTSVPSHNSYVGYATTDYVVAYYARDFVDAQNALDKLSFLSSAKKNRITLYNYSNPATPASTEYKLRVQEASCSLISDLDDDTMFNVICNLTVEGKRSLSDYQGTVVESFEIGV